MEPETNQPSFAQPTKKDMERLFETDFPLASESSNGSNGVIIIYIGVILQILYHHKELFNKKNESEMINTMNEIQARKNSETKNVRIRDLMQLICGPGFRSFWIASFTFGLIFKDIHQRRFKCNERKVYLQYKSLIIWYYIENYSAIDGILSYNPIYDEELSSEERKTMLQRMEDPSIEVIMFEELKSEDKKMDFCWHFLSHTKNYNIKGQTEFFERNFSLYIQKIKNFIETFRIQARNREDMDIQHFYLQWIGIQNSNVQEIDASILNAGEQYEKRLEKKMTADSFSPKVRTTVLTKYF